MNAFSRWQPIESAPKDGTSVRVPPQHGRNLAFWQDGIWWWHSSETTSYAAGPDPGYWLPDFTADDGKGPSSNKAN